MNQKDYKEIAGILKEHFEENENDRKSINDDRCNDVDKYINTISIILADYFEREYKNKFKEFDNSIPTQESFIKLKNIKFHRQQFLKDCGVKE